MRSLGSSRLYLPQERFRIRLIAAFGFFALPLFGYRGPATPRAAGGSRVPGPDRSSRLAVLDGPAAHSVHNLEIDQGHAYVVGGRSLLAHNQSAIPPERRFRSALGEEGERAALDAADKLLAYADRADALAATGATRPWSAYSQQQRQELYRAFFYRSLLQKKEERRREYRQKGKARIYDDNFGPIRSRFSPDFLAACPNCLDALAVDHHGVHFDSFNPYISTTNKVVRELRYLIAQHGPEQGVVEFRLRNTISVDTNWGDNARRVLANPELYAAHPELLDLEERATFFTDHALFRHGWLEAAKSGEDPAITLALADAQVADHLLKKYGAYALDRFYAVGQSEVKFEKEETNKGRTVVPYYPRQLPAETRRQMLQEADQLYFQNLDPEIARDRAAMELTSIEAAVPAIVKAEVKPESLGVPAQDRQILADNVFIVDRNEVKKALSANGDSTSQPGQFAMWFANSLAHNKPFQLEYEVKPPPAGSNGRDVHTEVVFADSRKVGGYDPLAPLVPHGPSDVYQPPRDSLSSFVERLAQEYRRHAELAKGRRFLLHGLFFGGDPEEQQRWEARAAGVRGFVFPRGDSLVFAFDSFLHPNDVARLLVDHFRSVQSGTTR